MEQVFMVLRRVVDEQRPKIAQALGHPEGDLNDDSLRELADIVHPQLPFAVRMVVKRDALARMFVSNRERVVSLLQQKL